LQKTSPQCYRLDLYKPSSKYVTILLFIAIIHKTPALYIIYMRIFAKSNQHIIHRHEKTTEVANAISNGL